MRSVLLAVLLCSGCAHMAEDQWTGRDIASILSPLQSWPLPVVNMGRQRQHHSDRQSQTVFINAWGGKRVV